MTISLTDEQRAVVDDGLVAQAIVACAGSGKTLSAVHRVADIRRRMSQAKGYVALLSYTNVAVETFRREHAEIAKRNPGLSDRIEITTVDSFIARNILLPHGARSMKCGCRPFLVNGNEGWLNAFTFKSGDYPVSISEISIALNGEGFVYKDVSGHGQAKVVAEGAVLPIIEKLAKVGAYTHDLARYWVLRILIEQPRLRKMLADRYPFVFIDEAQDIGSMHGQLVSVLRNSGVTVSLIGDPHQSIYQFADADGTVLRKFSAIAGVSQRLLTENHRSVSQIVRVADELAKTKSKIARTAPARKHGAYFMRYELAEVGTLVESFKAILAGHGYAHSEAAVLCRAKAWAQSVAGGADNVGLGATQFFAHAAIYRDKGDIAHSFECMVDGVLKILDSPPSDLRRLLLKGESPGEVKQLRRLIWDFLRQQDTGVPSSLLRADSEWIDRLKSRLPHLFSRIEATLPYKRLTSWRNNITRRGVGDGPLLKRDLLPNEGEAIRTCTVHKVKGESIDAVVYITRKGDLDKMLAGTDTEVGRIGYVAITRARDLLLLAIPSDTADKQIQRLGAVGFLPWQ